MALQLHATSLTERDPEAVRLETLRRELVGLLDRRTSSDGRHETAIPDLRLYRFSNPTEPAPVLQEPAVRHQRRPPCRIPAPRVTDYRRYRFLSPMSAARPMS